MAGSSPAMTNVAAWRNEPERAAAGNVPIIHSASPASVVRHSGFFPQRAATWRTKTFMEFQRGPAPRRRDIHTRYDNIRARSRQFQSTPDLAAAIAATQMPMNRDARKCVVAPRAAFATRASAW
jgi:hypothetical protein